MSVQLEHTIMNDGSRNFFSLPETHPFKEMYEQMKKLPGVTNVTYQSDEVTEVWIDFDYQNHHFSMNNQMGEYLFFVDDPSCKDDILEAIIAVFQ